MLFIRSSSVYVKSTRSLLLYGFIGWSLHSSVFLARQAVARITELKLPMSLVRLCTVSSSWDDESEGGHQCSITKPSNPWLSAEHRKFVQ